MRGVYVLDANIFLRVLVREEKKTFDECRRLLLSVKQNKIKAVIPGLVLSEVVWTLSSYYRFSKDKVIRGVRSILQLSGMRIVDRYDYRLALDLYRDHRVKYIDTCIASIEEVQRKKWTVVSYDRDFDALDVLRREPSELLM